jgi:hypothetical protein
MQKKHQVNTKPEGSHRERLPSLASYPALGAYSITRSVRIFTQGPAENGKSWTANPTSYSTGDINLVFPMARRPTGWNRFRPGAQKVTTCTIHCRFRYGQLLR